MKLFRVIVAVFILSVIASCTAVRVQVVPAPMLNSERITKKFGTYGVEVLDNKIPNLRVSSLYSTDAGRKITRTFAVTQFEPKLHPALSEAHKRIVEQNQSIGATFKELGFVVKKESLFIGDFEPKTACIFKLMGEVKPQPLAVYIYRLSLSKGDLVDLPYATITEINHPDYLRSHELTDIYHSAPKELDLSKTWAFIYAALGNLTCK